MVGKHRYFTRPFQCRQFRDVQDFFIAPRDGTFPNAPGPALADIDEQPTSLGEFLSPDVLCASTLRWKKKGRLRISAPPNDTQCEVSDEDVWTTCGKGCSRRGVLRRTWSVDLAFDGGRLRGRFPASLLFALFRSFSVFRSTRVEVDECSRQMTRFFSRGRFWRRGCAGGRDAFCEAQLLL